MKQCDQPLRWLFSLFSPSVVHLKRMHTSCVKNQSHWPGFEISAAGSMRTHGTKRGHRSNALCVQFSLWISMSWRNRLDGHLRSLEVCFLSDSLLSLLSSLDHQENHREWVEQMTLRKKQQKNNKAGVGEMAVAIKSIKESSKIRSEVTEKTKQNSDNNKTQRETS